MTAAGVMENFHALSHTMRDRRSPGSCILASGVDAPSIEELCTVCRTHILPLVDVDGGVLYVVSASEEEIHIHLAGTCSGCPGATLTREQLIVPALATVAPGIAGRVTTGFRIPAGATHVTSDD